MNTGQPSKKCMCGGEKCNKKEKSKCTPGSQLCNSIKIMYVYVNNNKLCNT